MKGSDKIRRSTQSQQVCRITEKQCTLRCTINLTKKNRTMK